MRVALVSLDVPDKESSFPAVNFEVVFYSEI